MISFLAGCLLTVVVVGAFAKVEFDRKDAEIKKVNAIKDIYCLSIQKMLEGDAK